MSGGVRVTGLRETVRRLERLGVETQDLKEAFARVARRVVVKSTALAPVRSGALRASIRTGNTKNKAVVRAGYAASVPYAGAINYGWPARGIRATEFLTRPANSDTEKYAAEVVAQLDRITSRLNA